MAPIPRGISAFDGRFAAITPRPFSFPGFRRRRQYSAYRYSFQYGGLGYGFQPSNGGVFIGWFEEKKTVEDCYLNF